MKLSQMPRKVGLACVVEKAGKMVEAALDPRKYRTPTFNHRLARFQSLYLTYKRELGK